MACLDPKTIKNPRYKPNKKNGGIPDIPDDPRDLKLVVPCGECVECKRRKASDWRFRMHQEYRYNPDKFYFVTFTFNDESLKALTHDDEFVRKYPDGYDDNDIVVFAVRRFLERYRKKYKVSLRHLFVSELGAEFGRIHIHGIVMGLKCPVKNTGFTRNRFPVLRSPQLADLWSYGFIYVEPCSDRCISYVLKYIMKTDQAHPDWVPKLLVSPGLGIGYVNPSVIRQHHSVPGFIWYCRTSSGYKIGMPRYYRLKIFTDEEREARKRELWDNPPPLVFRGQEFDDYWAYRRVVEDFHRMTLRLGLSKKNKTNVFRNNFEENICFYDLHL